MAPGLIETPVLIVGVGPAGLTASLLLSRHGVASLLIDKRSAASPLPRARGVHSRAMEILRVCGVEPDLRDADATRGGEIVRTPGNVRAREYARPPSGGEYF